MNVRQKCNRGKTIPWYNIGSRTTDRHHCSGLISRYTAHRKKTSSRAQCSRGLPAERYRGIGVGTRTAVMCSCRRRSVKLPKSFNDALKTPDDNARSSPGRITPFGKYRITSNNDNKEPVRVVAPYLLMIEYE